MYQYAADEGKTELKIDFRTKDIPHAAFEQEDERIRETRRLVHQVKNHSSNDALIEDLQKNCTNNSFSEESKKIIHNLGNVECFRMCEISSKTQCSNCSKFWAEGIVYCTCGTCLIPTPYPRRLTKKKFDASSRFLLFYKGLRHGARCGKTEAQREYRQAMDCLRKAFRKNVARSFSDFGFFYRGSQETVGWTEDTCRHLDGAPKEDNSCFATRYERQRYENNWNLALHAQGKNAPVTGRPDSSDAVKAIRDLREKE